MKNKNAFTLVELLAVIVILAVILVIAVPQVLDVIDTTKVGSLESSAKLIANSAEKKYAEFLALGKDISTIKCSDVTKLNDRDYGTCTISFDENGKATVLIKGKDDGKFDGLKCEGTKDNMVCGDIPPLPVINCTFTPSEEDLVETKVYTIKDYDACITYLKSTIPEEELTDEILNQADSVCKGNGIPEDGQSTSEIFKNMISGSIEIEQELIDLNVINVEFGTTLTPGTVYANGQYTYIYMMNMTGSGYNEPIYRDGWSVILTDKESTAPVTSDVCTYINNKPIVSMKGMFLESSATSLDLSSFNTSNVTDMSYMFQGSAVTSLDVSNFDTSKVTNMSYMFAYSKTTNFDLSGFYTNNVSNMAMMFFKSVATSLDLSSFDINNETRTGNMFGESAVTSGYAKTQADADKFNLSSGKPSTLTFVVKGS